MEGSIYMATRGGKLGGKMSNLNVRGKIIFGV